MTQVLTLVHENKWSQLQYVPEAKTIVLTFRKPYVPIEVFKAALEDIETFMNEESVEKMIFDKSNLTVFHQPSMEWYHIHWKVKMLEKGLRVYRKILPNDRLFMESVRIGRERIIRLNPDFDINLFDIRYCDSVADALRI